MKKRPLGGRLTTALATGARWSALVGGATAIAAAGAGLALGSPAVAQAPGPVLGKGFSSLVPGPAATKKKAAALGVSTGDDSLRVVSQSVFVKPGGDFKLHLDVSASRPGQDSLAVLVYGALTARSQFQVALGGNAVGSPIFNPPAVPLRELPVDPSGGVDVDIPMGQATGEAWPPSTTGVYPVQLFLENSAQARVGRSLNTFLVYTAKTSYLKYRLGVSVVVPFAARVPIRPTGSVGAVPAVAATEIETDAAALAGTAVPVTIAPEVATLTAMDAGTQAERAAIAHLKAAVASGDQVLPSTALPISLAQFEASGFTGDLKEEVNEGTSDLGDILDQPPSLQTWAFRSNIGPSTLAAAVSLGADRFVLPGADLTGLPAADTSLTFAQPTALNGGGHGALVVGADPELSSRIKQASRRSPVLTAYQVLAELAMIDLERPNDERGIVLMPPTGVIIAPGFLPVLLRGLRDNPLLEPLTVSQLFTQVPVASTASGPVSRSLAQKHRAPPVQGVGQLLTARAAVQADAEVYGPGQPLVAQLSNRLIVSLSSWFSAAQRSQTIAAVTASARRELHKVVLPPATSITLTSRQGQLPLTLNAEGPGPMKVLLVLRSEQLGFVGRHFAQGDCRQVTPGIEHCLLTLARTVTLNVPVVVKSVGTFPISVIVATPDGRDIIASRTDTVRSTAFSDVGLVLMAGAALFLVVWWARNARHGRRARKLVPRPDEDVGLDEEVPAQLPAGELVGREAHPG